MQLATSPASTMSRAVLPDVVTVLESLGHGVWIAGRDGETEYVNEIALGFLGPPGARHVAHVAGTEELYPPARFPLLRALAGEPAHVDDVEMWREADHVILEIAAHPLRDASGSGAGALVVLIDVTPRVRLSQTLRELLVARGRFQVAQEKAPMGLAMVGLDHRFTDVNAFLCRLTGRSREELIGLRPADLLDPEDAGKHRALNAALLAQGGDDYHELVDIVRGPGDVVSAELTVGLIRDDSGAPMHQIILAQDVTERRDTERLVADLNASLAEHGAELRRLNGDLGRTNHDLLRSNRDLEQFAYIASHDLSEPLRSVAGYVQLLARRYRGQLDPDADEFIEFAVDGVNRMQTLIRDLLAYARVDVGGKAVAVDCAALVAEIARGMAETRPEVELELGPLPVVVSEEAPLRQVFDNLVSNAVKFVPAERSPRITVSAEQEEGCWRFRVADNGIGIDEHHRERIFAMFQRLHGRSDYPGTGIGLAIVRRVVERLGGSITVGAAAGGGAAFTFTIPSIPAESP